MERRGILRNKITGFLYEGYTCCLVLSGALEKNSSSNPHRSTQEV